MNIENYKPEYAQIAMQAAIQAAIQATRQQAQQEQAIMTQNFTVYTQKLEQQKYDLQQRFEAAIKEIKKLKEDLLRQAADLAEKNAQMRNKPIKIL